MKISKTLSYVFMLCREMASEEILILLACFACLVENLQKELIG